MSKADDPFREIEQLFDQVMNFGGTLGREVPVDVVDTDDEIVVLADLPGRDPADIHVQLRNNRQLQIEAAAPADEDIEGQYLTRERAEQSTSRTVSLPTTVKDGDTAASYDRGVLTVRLPKPTTADDGTEIPVE